ncbi:hypothetical protein AGMMS49960_10220 [Betaproteobacteria bacterium]|nr:hypothetical protein AGMMS49543_26750 [Betaproteobacteria bacterium]GHU00955.1 hypothetical protein AGMMS49960_10220 [Betaproteobacteria bacterium]GHU13319.1 hypothetical protein AGMMS50225_23110 [Betaproteobacteria bacterium]GHU13363.1 hypothetical protein AGMMS50225_23240 [Betaproteobacteria bacterium]GHU19889.1 hypothetical protein AGMMS50243_13020 [Betaproteobacteria bacterium]
MARYMLDTNMCIYLMKQQPVSVVRRFAECYVGDVVISAITYAELEVLTTLVDFLREQNRAAPASDAL